MPKTTLDSPAPTLEEQIRRAYDLRNELAELTERLLAAVDETLETIKEKHADEA